LIDPAGLRWLARSPVLRPAGTPPVVDLTDVSVTTQTPLLFTLLRKRLLLAA
jgi:hypothetical protein